MALDPVPVTPAATPVVPATPATSNKFSYLFFDATSAHFNKLVSPLHTEDGNFDCMSLAAKVMFFLLPVFALIELSLCIVMAPFTFIANLICGCLCGTDDGAKPTDPAPAPTAGNVAKKAAGILNTGDDAAANATKAARLADAQALLSGNKAKKDADFLNTLNAQLGAGPKPVAKPAPTASTDDTVLTGTGAPKAPPITDTAAKADTAPKAKMGWGAWAKSIASSGVAGLKHFVNPQ